ncbi:MAG: hypothetical protein KIT80_11430 [Chitinophagaceae bacterium]|nr:hypothetical protein [Chitinophagaceae bacterium]MCW5927513.1 hypothetical protein [Chitinophagaceae bacterium]
MRYCLCVCLLFGFGTAGAQDDKPRYIFRSINQVALINGKDLVSAGLQTVNGVACQNWYLGLGVGLDFYRYRSVPLFVDLRREINLKKDKLFLYADGGYNLPWAKDSEDRLHIWSNTIYRTINEYRGGEYADLGLGYAVAAGKKGSAFLLSAGYSYKRFKKTTTSTVESNVPNPTVETTDVQKFDYHFNRLMIRIGWQF